MIKAEVITVDLQITLSDPQLARLHSLDTIKRWQIKQELYNVEGVDLVMMEEPQIRKNTISIQIDKPKLLEQITQNVSVIFIKQLS